MVGGHREAARRPVLLLLFQRWGSRREGIGDEDESNKPIKQRESAQKKKQRVLSPAIVARKTTVGVGVRRRC